MSQPAKSNDADLHPWARSPLLQGLVDSRARTKHHRRILTRQPLRDRENTVRIVATGIREPAIRNVAVRVAVAIRTQSARTIILLASGTALAFACAARVALRSDAHTIADFDTWTGMGADMGGVADDLVADAAGVDCFALKRVNVNL